MSAVPLPLSTPRLMLRTFREDDVGWAYRVYARADVATYLLEGPWSLEMAQEKVKDRIARTDIDGPSGALALVIEKGGSPVGNTSLWFTDRDRRVAEIGWVLDPEQTGYGYATEAVKAVLALAFDHYRVHRVAAQMDSRNVAPANLAKRVGMRQEAHLREDFWSKGEWTDTLIFGMLAGDRI